MVQVNTRLYRDSSKSYKNVFDCFSTTVRGEGILALWKGANAQLLRVGPQTVLTFVGYEKLKKLANENWNANG